MAANFLYLTFLYPLIYIFPAYAANGAPVLFGGGPPLDLKKKIGKKRIFGDNKTIRGTLAALIAGVAAGIIESLIFGMPFLIPLSLMLAIGTVFGDLLGSFIKRRMNFKSGASFLVMDQYGFLFFAFLFALYIGHTPTLYGILFIVILTGLMHPLTNLGANKLKLKSVPW